MASPRDKGIEVKIKIKEHVDCSSLSKFSFSDCLRLFFICRQPAWDGSQNTSKYCAEISRQCLAGQMPEEWKRFVK